MKHHLFDTNKNSQIVKISTFQRMYTVVIITYTLILDPAYQQPTPNLDGTEEHSQHILFGTNIKMSDETPGSGGAADETPGSGGAADETPGSGGEERGEGDEVGSKREGEGLKEQVVAAKPNEVEKQDEDGANGEVIVKEEQLSQGDGQV